MKVLFVGGTGNISLDCSTRALGQGIELWHLNRGTSAGASLPGVVTLRADIRDEAAASAALAGESFDAVVDFVAYSARDIEEDLRLFGGRTGQLVFISSASAYQKPPLHHVVTETTPLSNPFWKYSSYKIEAEEALVAGAAAAGLPYTIVRPAHTYGSTWLPTAFGSRDFTIAKRILEGRRVIVHGDGQALWTLTHARDFAVGLVGLLGNPGARNEAVQITGDEVLTWEAIYRTVAAALGAQLNGVHIPSDFIASVNPARGAQLLGDKSYSTIFDCSKLRRLVPEFRTTVSFAEGARESAAWYLADPARQKINPELDAEIDGILAAWEGKLSVS